MSDICRIAGLLATNREKFQFNDLLQSFFFAISQNHTKEKKETREIIGSRPQAISYLFRENTLLYGNIFYSEISLCKRTRPKKKKAKNQNSPVQIKDSLVIHAFGLQFFYKNIQPAKKELADSKSRPTKELQFRGSPRISICKANKSIVQSDEFFLVGFVATKKIKRGNEIRD